MKKIIYMALGALLAIGNLAHAASAESGVPFRGVSTFLSQMPHITNKDTFFKQHKTMMGLF
jgi:hypothetical protein